MATRCLSEPIRPYLFQQRTTADIQAITWAQLIRSTATQVQNPPLYMCACPFGSGPELTRVFVYDLLRQAWTILTFPVPFATIDAQYDPGVEPYVLAGEQGGGRVQRLFAGDSQDDGANVSWTVRLAPVKGRSTTDRMYIRRVAGQSGGYGRWPERHGQGGHGAGGPAPGTQHADGDQQRGDTPVAHEWR